MPLYSFNLFHPPAKQLTEVSIAKRGAEQTKNYFIEMSVYDGLSEESQKQRRDQKESEFGNFLIPWDSTALNFSIDGNISILLIKIFGYPQKDLHSHKPKCSQISFKNCKDFSCLG